MVKYHTIWMYDPQIRNGDPTAEEAKTGRYKGLCPWHELHRLPRCDLTVGHVVGQKIPKGREQKQEERQRPKQGEAVKPCVSSKAEAHQHETDTGDQE